MTAAPIADPATRPSWHDAVGSDMWQRGTAECGCGRWMHIAHEVDEHATELFTIAVGTALKRRYRQPILATLHDPETCSEGLDVAHVDVRMRSALKGLAVPAGVTVLAVDRAMLAAVLRGLPVGDPTAALAAVAAEAESEAVHTAAGTATIEAYLQGVADAEALEDDSALEAAAAAGLVTYTHLPLDDNPAAMWFAATLNPLNVDGTYPDDDRRRRTEARVRHQAALAGEVPPQEAIEAWHMAVEAALAAVAAMTPTPSLAPVAVPVPVAPAAPEADPAATVSSSVTDPSGAIASIAAEAQAALEYASEPELLDKIFCTRELSAQRENSRLALVSPMVGLMADLGAMLSMIPPSVTFPPIVSKRSGFNFIHTVVGPSGAGKGGAMDPSVIIQAGVGRGLPRVQGAAGSGEVIASKFTKVTIDEDGSKHAEIHTESVRLYWPEITKIAAVKGRSGATIGAELCQGWSSEELGADTKSEASFAEAHTYRLTATIGAQLATIALLFDPDSALMGLSQRLWLISALLTEIPAPGTPEWDELIDAEVLPEPRYVTIPPFSDGDVAVETAVRREVRELRLQGQIEPGPEAALETHVNLMRLRIAVAVALLHGEPPAVTMRWWRWTDHMVEHHRRVRRAGQIAAQIATTAGAVSAGVFDATRAEARFARQRQTALDAQRRWCAKRNDWFAYRDAQQGTKAGTYRREHLQSLLDELVTSGELLASLVDGVPRHFWVGQQTSS